MGTDAYTVSGAFPRKRKASFEEMKANDGKCVIAMPSMTTALQAERLLGGGGIHVRVIKLPQGRTQKGCAYGIELPCVYAYEAVKRLDIASVRHGDLL